MVEAGPDTLLLQEHGKRLHDVALGVVVLVIRVAVGVTGMEALHRSVEDVRGAASLIHQSLPFGFPEGFRATPPIMV